MCLWEAYSQISADETLAAAVNFPLGLNSVEFTEWVQSKTESDLYMNDCMRFLLEVAKVRKNIARPWKEKKITELEAEKMYKEHLSNVCVSLPLTLKRNS